MIEDEFQWIKDIIPTGLYPGIKFIIDKHSDNTFDLYYKTHVLEIIEVSTDMVYYYITSTDYRHHKTSRDIDKSRAEKLINHGYWQPYDGEHIK